MSKLSQSPINLYGNAYGNYSLRALEQVRRDTYDEDIGQSGWMTCAELRMFAEWLNIGANSQVLDVCSGSGGPATFLARTYGCHVTGVDSNSSGIQNAQSLVAAQGLESRLTFLAADASLPLPVSQDSFDAILCVDAIIHLHDRRRVLADWHRLLRHGGRLLYTDPAVISGLISNEEISIRSSIGYFEFAPPGENESLIVAAGFRLTAKHDATENAALVSGNWHHARARYRNELVPLEGKANFEGLQRFLRIVNQLTRERRLTRWVFVAEKV